MLTITHENRSNKSFLWLELDNQCDAIAIKQKVIICTSASSTFAPYSTSTGCPSTYPHQHLSDPEQHLADPYQHLADPDQRLVDPNQRLADSDQHFADPGQHLADPGLHLADHLCDVTHDEACNGPEITERRYACVDRMSSALPTMWMGTQSGRLFLSLWICGPCFYCW